MLNRRILISAAMMLCLLLTFANCSSDDDGETGKLNPKYRLSLAIEPAWVSDRIGDGEFSVYATIDKGTHNNQTVYIFGSCCPTCDVVPVIYDQNGTQLEIITFVDITINKTVYRGTACTERLIID